MICIIATVKNPDEAEKLIEKFGSRPDITLLITIKENTTTENSDVKGIQIAIKPLSKLEETADARLSNLEAKVDSIISKVYDD